MQLLDKLERRFGNWAIPQFALFITAANGAIYLLALQRSEFLYQLILEPDAIRQGQVWRLITFLFVPPMMNPLLEIFWLLLLYQVAQALENEWGDFRFCLYYAIGGLATIAVAGVIGETLSNVPLNASLFLAFAKLFPDFELLLFFIIPVKVKDIVGFIWLGVPGILITASSRKRAAIVVLIAALLLFYYIFFIIATGAPIPLLAIIWSIPWLGLMGSLISGPSSIRIAIAASLVNYGLFFGEELWQTLKLKIEVYRNRRRLGGGKE